MIQTIRKRSGQTVKFNTSKIRTAITKANRDVKNTDPTAKTLTRVDIENVLERILKSLENTDQEINIELVQDTVEKVLANYGFFEVSKSYILYREKHRQQREANETLMRGYNKFLFSEAKDDDSKRENGNINGDSSMGIMLKLGSEGAKTYAKYYSMPDEFLKAYEERWTHYHDLDFSQICWNCCQIDLLKLLHGGFSTGHGYIREPQSIRAYASLACVVIQSNQNDMFRN